jgi:hypothetical protein
VKNYSVFDSVRNHTYKVQAASEAAAIQNDQWSEQLHACELEPNRE